MAHTFTHLLVHIIFGTKDREPWLTEELKTPLHSYLAGILRNLEVNLTAVNGTADHVHLLVMLPADQSVAEVLRVLKTNSSRWVHETYPNLHSFGWQTGYGAFTVSRSNLDAVERYIRNQEEHHKKQTFQEEFVAFLDRHGIEYDARYLWE